MAKASARIQGSLVAKLEQLSEQVQGPALRSAAHAGAEVVYNELHARVPRHSGALKSAIYRWHDDKASVPGRQVYAAGVNMAKAPHWHNVEYGHWRINVVVRDAAGRMVFTKERLPQPVWVPASPYLRPAFEAARATAEQAMRQRFYARLAELRAGGDAAATEATA